MMNGTVEYADQGFLIHDVRIVYHTVERGSRSPLPRSRNITTMPQNRRSSTRKTGRLESLTTIKTASMPPLRPNINRVGDTDTWRLTRRCRITGHDHQWTCSTTELRRWKRGGRTPTTNHEQRRIIRAGYTDKEWGQLYI